MRVVAFRSFSAAFLVIMLLYLPFNASSQCTVTGCSTCRNFGGGCRICSSGYYLSGTTCIACSSNCNACTSSGCTSCNSGYSLDSSNAVCQQTSSSSSSSSSSNVGIIVGIVVGVVCGLAIAIAIAKFFCCKRRQGDAQPAVAPPSAVAVQQSVDNVGEVPGEVPGQVPVVVPPPAASRARRGFWSRFWSKNDDWKDGRISHLRTSSDASCAICLEGGAKILTNCGHQYHFTCLSNWLKRKKSCPLCVSFNIDPLRVFCERCRSSYIEIGFRSYASEQGNIQKYCWQCRNNERSIIN